MNVQEEIKQYIAAQPEAKRAELQTLHERILSVSPGCRLWYTDGRNSEGKVVANPNIGYGAYTIHYADGSSREFYRIGLSANTGGISVYIMGIPDKTYLTRTFGQSIGKASVTGYCIKFKKLQDIHFDTLEAAIRYGFELANEQTL